MVGIISIQHTIYLHQHVMLSLHLAHHRFHVGVITRDTIVLAHTMLLTSNVWSVRIVVILHQVLVLMTAGLIHSVIVE